MASSYVFRKIDSDLWREMRGECTKRDVKLLELVEGFFRTWLSEKATASDAVDPDAQALESRPRAHALSSERLR